jgi:hypothetical protein
MNTTELAWTNKRQRVQGFPRFWKEGKKVVREILTGMNQILPSQNLASFVD